MYVTQGRYFRENNPKFRNYVIVIVKCAKISTFGTFNLTNNHNLFFYSKIVP